MNDILFEIGEGQKLQRVDELEKQGKFDDYAVGMYLGRHIRGDYGIIADQVKRENAEILALNPNDREDKTIYSLYEVDDFDIGISTKLGATPEENWTTVMTGLDMDRIFGMMRKRMVNDEHMRNPEAIAHFAKKEGKVKVGRNEPCLCGSGKKYKKCCLD